MKRRELLKAAGSVALDLLDLHFRLYASEATVRKMGRGTRPWQRESDQCTVYFYRHPAAFMPPSEAAEWRAIPPAPTASSGPPTP